MNVLTCPICHHEKHESLHRVAHGDLMSCGKCQVVFFTPMPTAKELETFYNNGYHDNFSKSTMAGSSFAKNRYIALEELLKAHLPSFVDVPNKSLLDIGCGTGNFLEVAQQAGWRISGTELGQDAVERATQRLGDCIFQGDISALDLPSDSYDLITSYHVVEHLLDPVKKLQHCYRLLSSKGALFVETPNISSIGARIRGAKWSHIIPPEHIVYFSPSSLRFALHEAGFEKVLILTSAPQTVESIQKWPDFLKEVAIALYNFAPKIGMGAALQAIAFKD